MAPALTPPLPPTAEEAFLYEEMARKITQLIDKGTFPPGSKLPSIRSLCDKWNVSVSTIVEAYRILDDRGIIEVRPKSGHFVRRGSEGVFSKAPTQLTRLSPTAVQVSDLTLMLFHDTNNPAMVKLGAGIVSPDQLPLEKLQRITGSLARRYPAQAAMYEFPPGNERLRKEIAKRGIDSGCVLHPNEIIITSGCMEAVTICLQAVCKPNDIVALESPAYYGFLQIIEALNLQALEIPCTYPDGICLEALQFVLEHHPVKACLVITSFNNPLGSNMSEEKRQKLVNLASAYKVPLIEDDIYSDLCFQEPRFKALKSYDRSGQVMLCSSFSKTLAPGYRVGWVCAGAYQNRVEKIKAVTSVATASLPQMIIAEFLAEGGYGAHLRRIRRINKTKVEWLIQAVRAYFPSEAIVYAPAGGSMVWVELSPKADSLRIYEEALKEGITVAPGLMFSTKDRYRHCLRLNAAYVSPDLEPYIRTLGRIVRKQS